MGRPHKFRKLSEIRPRFRHFHPVGEEPEDLENMFLTPEEFEALRLRHYENKKQTLAAEEMEISQTTFSRIITRAYAKLTKALVEGYGIMLNYPDHPLSETNPLTDFNSPPITFRGYGCMNCGYAWEIATPPEKGGANEGKPQCPECFSRDTYRLIKKLTPERPID